MKISGSAHVVDSYRCGCNDKCPWWTVIVDGQLSVLQCISFTAVFVLHRRLLLQIKLRAVNILMRKGMGHTAGSTIKDSSVTF